MKLIKFTKLKQKIKDPLKKEKEKKFDLIAKRLNDSWLNKAEALEESEEYVQSIVNLIMQYISPQRFNSKSPESENLQKWSMYSFIKGDYWSDKIARAKNSEELKTVYEMVDNSIEMFLSKETKEFKTRKEKIT